MPRTVSREFFVAEFILIVLPYGLVVTAGLGVLLVAAVGAAASGDAMELLTILALVAFTVPYLAGFAISLNYLRGGVDGILATRRTTWILAYVGAAVASAAVVGTVFGHWIPWPFPAPTPDENPFAFAPETVGQAFAPGLFLAPLLVPFGHLLWERRKAFRDINIEVQP
jgi:hypothetical protein